VTRGWLPQRAGLPGLNGGGAAAAVPIRFDLKFQIIAQLFDLTETYPAKTRGTGILYGEYCTILTLTVFDRSILETEEQADRRAGDSI